MAIWQWDIWLVPKDEAIKHFPTIPQYMELDWFESIDWWKEVSQSQLVDFFDSIFHSQTSSNSRSTISWGDYEKTCVRLIEEEGKIIDLFVRIDVRQSNGSFIESLINFAEKYNFLFFTLETNRFIKPELSTFLESLNNSRAKMFVTNPDKIFENNNYLDKLKKENLHKIDKLSNE